MRELSKKQLEALGEPLGESVTRIEGLRRIYGGGGKGDAPDAPDYSKLAQEQAQQQLALNRSTTKSNRIDQFTPFGSLTYTQGGGSPTFDEAGYNAAVQRYNQQASSGASRYPNLPLNYLAMGTPSLGTNLRLGSGYGYGSGSSMAAPRREDFMSSSDPDKWSSTVTLSPEVQAIVDQKLAAQGQNYDALQSYLQNIQNNSLIPKAPVNAGMTGQQALMARLDPTWNTSEDALRTRLANQGVNPGTEAWENEFRNFSQGRNDAYNQAALYGINLDNQARATALQEQQLPMAAISNYVNGTQTPYPTFSNYAQQANAAAPDLMGAQQAQFQGQLGAYNANQASQSNMMSGLMGLAGTYFGGPIGGALGSALGGIF